MSIAPCIRAFHPSALLVILAIAWLVPARSRAAEDVVVDQVEVIVEKTEIKDGAKVLGTASKGQQFTLEQTNGAWLLIAFRKGTTSQKGWVQADHVKVTRGVTVKKYSEEEWKRLDELELQEKEITRLINEGKKGEAIEPYRKAVAIRQQVHGEDHVNTGRALFEMGRLLVDTANYAQGRQYVEKSLPILRAKLGEEDQETEQAWDYLGRACSNLADFPAMIAAFEKVLTIAEARHGKGDLKTATPMIRLAAALARMNQAERAQTLGRQGLAICREKAGPKHALTLEALNLLSQIDMLLGDISNAAKDLEQLLPLKQELLGKQHASTVDTMSLLGVVLTRLGRYGEAQPVLEQAVSIQRQTAGSNGRSTAGALTSLGNFHLTMGNAAVARHCLDEAIAIEDALLVKQPNDEVALVALGTSLIAMCRVQQLLGDLGAALSAAQRGVEVNRRSSGERSLNTALALSRQGSVLGALGRQEEAEASFEKALAIFREVGGEKHQLMAQTMAEQAAFYLDNEQPMKARPLLLKAASIYKQLLGVKDIEYSGVLALLGQACMNSGDYRTAKTHLEAALQLARETHGNEHLLTIMTELRLGCDLIGLSDYAAADQLLSHAVPLLRDLYGDSNPSVAYGLTFQARLENARSQPVAAANYMDQARRSSRLHVARVLPGLSDAEQLAYLAKVDQPNLHFGLRLAAENPAEPQIVSLSAEWLINGKALAQEALARRLVLGRAISSSALDELTRLQTQLASLSTRQPSAQDQQAQRELSIQLEAKQRELSRELAKANLGLERPDPWIGLETIRRAVPANAVLVDIARYNRHEHGLQPTGYSAWIIPPVGKGEVVLVELGADDEIDDLVKVARQALNAAPDKIADVGEADSESACRKALRALAERALDPVLAKAGDARRLLISPDSQLWLAPWSALPLADGAYAIEKYQVELLVSGRELATRGNRLSAQAGTPLVLADPDYDCRLPSENQPVASTLTQSNIKVLERGASTSEIPASFVALPGTAQEARAIAPHISKYAGVSPQTLTRDQALEGVLKAAKGPKVLTLCTHGFFLADQELLASDTDLPLEQSRASAKSKSGAPLTNPLLRCGLALAGANRRAQVTTGADDGILTGLEIVGTDLRGTELVVLSACETGIGEVKNGEGVAGLRQAFQLAGAKAVLSTLWRIPDAETAQLMDRFWQEMAAGKSKGEALRAAQLELIRSRRGKADQAPHPFFWAAFTLTGQ